MKRNGYFTFHRIIDIAGVRGAIPDAVCVGSPVIIIIEKNQQTSTSGFSTRVGTIAHR